MVPSDAVATRGDAAPPTAGVSVEATSPTTTATSRTPTPFFFLDRFNVPPRIVSRPCPVRHAYDTDFPPPSGGAYFATYPPSTGRATPVTFADMSEAR